jgi:D-alanyl-D-alanine carboxypeptidase
VKIKKPPTLLRLLAAILALVLVCLGSVACDTKKDPSGTSTDNGPPNGTNKDDEDNKVYTYEYKTDVSEYLSSITAENLLLVNKQNPLQDSYVPTSLVKLPASITPKEIELDSTVAEALEAMINEMRADGIDDVFVTSAYRSYEYQTYLYNYYFNLEKEKAPDLSDDQIKQTVLSYSAYPGTSEHQSGLCVDFMTPEMLQLVNYGSETDAETDKGFAETAAFEWLTQNAYKFGFILRYPESKTDTTGYSYESWHYRFVGRNAATTIHFEGITLEEYLSE